MLRVRSPSVGSLLAPPRLSFSSSTLHLLPCCPPHQSSLCQEAAPELSVGSKRLRKQVRKNWSRTEGRWRAGSRRQAEGCQEEPGTLGQHFSASLPGWAQPHLLAPAPARLLTPPGSSCPPFQEGRQSQRSPPGTGVRSPMSQPQLLRSQLCDQLLLGG